MFWRTMQNVFHNVFLKAMFFSDVHESCFYMRMSGNACRLFSIFPIITVFYQSTSEYSESHQRRFCVFYAQLQRQLSGSVFYLSRSLRFQRGQRMEVFNNPTPRLWADPLQFLHHKDYGGGVDVVTSHRNQVYPDLYIGESGQFDLHHRKQRSELLVQTQEIQSFMKWVPHPLCRMNPIESLDLQKRISEMKEAKAAHQAESRIYEAAVAIQSKVRQMQATLQATITSSKQQGSSQTMIPKTQAGKLSKKTSEQSEQGKSLQSKQHNSEGLLQCEQSTNHKINDNMPKISAKQRRAKKGVEGSSTKKGVKESSTYFTVGFKPQAETVFSSKTKSGPEQSNDIGSGKAEHVN